MDDERRRRPLGDRPIDAQDEDRFGFSQFADALSAQIKDLPNYDSHVLGLVGPWGSGKTSIIHLLVNGLRGQSADILPLYFNPWLFNGIEQLATNFLEEIATQLQEQKDEKLRTVGKVLAEYGEVFGKSILKFVPPVAPASGFLGKLLKMIGLAITGKFARGVSLHKRREQIEKLLEKSQRRLLIVIDDVDRLQGDEIREMMRLIRLVADFPNVNYLLAFDKTRVATALSGADDGNAGEKYLEKIVQFTFEVPVVVPGELLREFQFQLQATIKGMQIGPFDPGVWSKIVRDMILPIIKTPRDVRRVMNALPFAIRLYKNEVAIGDLIALEAVRLLMPSVFTGIQKHSRILVQTVPPKAVPPSEAGLIQDLVRDTGLYEEAGNAFLCTLFPVSARYLKAVPFAESYAVEEWKRDRRVAHPDIMAIYLARRIPVGMISFSLIEQVLDSSSDAAQLDRVLSDLDAGALEVLFTDLLAHVAELSEETIHVIVPAFYKVAKVLREGRDYMFDLGGDFALGTLVFRLARRLRENNRFHILRLTFERLPHLSAKLDFLQNIMPPRDEEAPAELQSLVAELRADLLSTALSTSAEELANERDLLAIVVAMQSQVSPPDQVAEWIQGKVAENRSTLIALVRSALTETLSAALGGGNVSKTVALQWDLLEALIPDALNTVPQIELGAVGDVRARMALELATKYLNGWRPERERRTSSAPPDEAKALVSLRSAVAKKRMVAYKQLEDILTPKSTEGLGVVVRRFAGDTQLTLNKIARNPRYPAVERAISVRLLTKSGADAAIRAELTKMWLKDPSVDDQISYAMTSMWENEPSAVLQLAEIVKENPSAGARPGLRGKQAVYAAIRNMVESGAVEIPEGAIERVVSILRENADEPQLETIVREITTLLGPDVRGTM